MLQPLPYQIIGILLDKSRLAGSEEAGNEIYFYHLYPFLSEIIIGDLHLFPSHGL